MPTEKLPLSPRGDVAKCGGYFCDLRENCLRGHLELAEGRTAAGILREVEEFWSAHEEGRGPRGKQQIQALRRAQCAFEQGKPLLAGFHPDDLTTAQREQLRGRRS